MGCCCSCFARCEPCCRFFGCSCRERGGKNMTDIDKNRSCTDVPFLALFIGFIGFLAGWIWGPAFTDGNPNRLINAVQFDGQICGVGGMSNYSFGYFPAPTSFRYKVCVNNCSQTQDVRHLLWGGVPYKTKPYLDRYCVPDGGNVSISGFSGSSNQFQSAMADVQIAAPIVGASAAIALVCAFAYLLFLRMCVGCLVWTTISLIIVGGAVSGYALFSNAQTIEDADTKQAQEIFSYILLAATFIFFCVVIWARKRIQIAIEVIRSAGRALTDMKLLVLFPLNALIFACGFFAFWIAASFYLFSAGPTIQKEKPSSITSGVQILIDGAHTATTTANYSVIDYQTTIESQFAPHFFGLLWIFQFCVYFTYLVIAGAVADWYFTARDENGHKIRGPGEMELGTKPVCESCCRSFKWHMGTIALASGIIAAIQFARWVIRYMERTMNGGKEPNRLQKLLMRLVDCLLWCLECCLDKISRSALIFTAIYGDAFCPAVCGSFALMWRNLVRVAVISFFSTIITALGKVMIPLMTVGLCGLILVNVESFSSRMGSVLFPLALILVLAYLVGYMFLVVYDTAIDTVFMCFLIDEEANKDSGTMLADEALRNIVQKYEAESKEMATAMGAGDKTTGETKTASADNTGVQI